MHAHFRRVITGSALVSATASGQQPAAWFVSIAVAVSVLAHAALFAGVAIYASRPKEILQPITVRIVPKEKPAPAQVEPQAEEPPPPKPKPKPKKEKVANERKPITPPVKPVAPVQGLSPDALAPDGKGMAAPVGNTLMVEDDGKRLRPEDVQPLSGDLSADPKLIRATMSTPAYTDDAIDIGLEGLYVVDVYVDETGKVSTAELPKKVGYGMDERLITAATKARFEPRKNRYGKAEAGWSTISFRLELP